MTPAARVQAAIELLDAIIDAARGEGAPADRLIADYFRQRRYAGSKDRRAVRDLVYSAIRACGPMPHDGRAAILCLAGADPSLKLLFDGSTHGPPPVEDGELAAEAGIAPEWLVERLARSGIEGADAKALLDRAPLDLRVNTLKASRDMLDLPVVAQPTEAPHGLRLREAAQVEQWPHYRDGLVEIQDTGSQLACLAIAARPGETVIDLCAGAGGKTLALAAAMENTGHLVACDTDKRRLGNLPPRAARAGTRLIETRLLDPGSEWETLTEFDGAADAVLVDAPCSGTGTWRRNPEARWRLTAERLDHFTRLQARLLDLAARLVKPGGRIAYVTCSLLDEEGAGQVARFLSEHGEWTRGNCNLPLGEVRGDGYRLAPHRDGCDGFFIACLEFAC